MLRKPRTKTIKRLFLIFVVIGALLTHFFIPRLISDIRNPIVGLIKRNHNVKHELVSNENSVIKSKTFTVTSFDGFKLSARLTYSNSE